MRLYVWLTGKCPLQADEASGGSSGSLVPSTGWEGAQKIWSAIRGSPRSFNELGQLLDSSVDGNSEKYIHPLPHTSLTCIRLFKRREPKCTLITRPFIMLPD